MAASTPPPSKHRYWLVIFGLVSVAVIITMAILAYSFFTLRVSTRRDDTALEVTPTLADPALSLPTSSASPAIENGPPLPETVDFAAEEPIKGFSSCEGYGVRGMVIDGNGEGLHGVQVVVWEEGVGLLGLNFTDVDGNYGIEVEGEPGLHKLWVQVYRNDLPVSQAVVVETQIDCQIGFQIYEVVWRSVE